MITCSSESGIFSEVYIEFVFEKLTLSWTIVFYFTLYIEYKYNIGDTYVYYCTLAALEPVGWNQDKGSCEVT